MLPFDSRRPFTRSQGLAAGLTPGRLRGPTYRTVLRGVYVEADVPDTPLVRAGAALLVHPPSAAATHFTAARLVGAPVPPHANEHVTVRDPADRRPRPGLLCHVAALEVDEIRLLSGLRISAPHRLFVELASALTLVDLVVVGDWLVRRGHTTPGRLVDHCRRFRGRYAAQAREAAAYVRERVDSPMETKLRLLLVLAGLPEPVVNYELRDDFGAVVMRLDLSYPQLQLAIEYDGRHHLESAQQWERDVERRELLGDDRWRLITVTSKGIHREPEQTVLRVRRALAQRGCRLPPPSEQWRAHFA